MLRDTDKPLFAMICDSSYNFSTILTLWGSPWFDKCLYTRHILSSFCRRLGQDSNSYIWSYVSLVLGLIRGGRCTTLKWEKCHIEWLLHKEKPQSVDSWQQILVFDQFYASFCWGVSLRGHLVLVILTLRNRDFVASSVSEKKFKIFLPLFAI